MAQNIANVACYVEWLLYIVWYSFAPLVAPVLGPIIVNIFQGTGTITVGTDTLSLKEGMGIYGLVSERQSFFLVMDMAPRLGCKWLNSFGLTCTLEYTA